MRVQMHSLSVKNLTLNQWKSEIMETGFTHSVKVTYRSLRTSSKIWKKYYGLKWAFIIKRNRIFI